jgi:hypothetical protein
MYDKKDQTIPKLLPIIKNKTNFPWETLSLYRVVKSLGFKRRTCQSERKIPVETAGIVACRSRYLKEIQKYQDNGSSIFHTDETWIQRNLTFHKCWQKDEVMSSPTNVNSENRLIMLHI